MKSIKQFLFIVLLGLLFVCKSSFALPFSVTPLGTLPTTVDNVSDVAAYYTVRNTTSQNSPGNFVKFLPPFVKQVVDKTQPTFCGAVFNLAPNGSCILALNISGPVYARDPNPEHHLFVCRAGGKTCAGTAYELNVTQISLVSIAVTPTSASIPKGTTQQYAATGTFSDGSTRSLLTYDVVWSSSNTGVATIDASTGLATGVGVGSSFIRASLGGISSPPMGATLTVTNAVLTSILVTPDPSTTPKGTTLQFRAVGSFTDGTTADITSLSTTFWTSSDETVATIGLHTGLATGVSVSPPTTSITASSGSITSNASTLTVTDKVIECITVTPDPANVAIGGTLQFTATATYSDGTNGDITSTATWVSSTPSKATIDSAGLATGVAEGTTTITAAQDGVTSEGVVLTISATLLSIAVTPDPMVIYVGESFQFTATGTYDSGPTADITTSSGWGSSNPGIATVGASTGIATGVATGTTNIMAAKDSVSGSAELTVNDQILYAGLVNTNVCRSTDGGGIWANCTSVSGIVSSLAAAVGSIYAGTAAGVCNNLNTPATWTCPAGAIIPSVSAVAALDLQFVYAGSNSANQFVCVSNDDGDNFSCVQVFPGAVDLLTSLAVTDTTHLYAGIRTGVVCTSTDNGSTWPGPPCVTTGLSFLASLAVDRATGHVYAGGNLISGMGAVCKSINGGGTFPSCSTPFTGRAISLAAADGYVYAGTNSGGRVCVSTDDAANFTCVALPGASTSITSLTLDRYGSVFAGTADGRVCRSFDHGTTWPSNLCQTVSGGSQVNGLALTLP